MTIRSENRPRSLLAFVPQAFRATAVAMLWSSVVAVALACTPLVPAQAQQVQRIAAVVNDDVISVMDVQERLALTMVTSAIPNTPENRQKILPNVVRALVDDQLRLQEAKRVKITVTDADVAGAIRRIEENNKLPQGASEGMMQRAGVPFSALQKQVRAQVAWVKAVQQSLRRQVVIQPEEIDAMMAQVTSMQGKPRQRVAELVVPVNSPDQEQQAKALAERLVEQVQQGAKFSALAQQFSAAATASRGGDLGWVIEGQMVPEVDEIVRTLAPGQVSAPVRTATGYTLLFLVERRAAQASSPADIQFGLSQIYMPTNGRAAVPAQKRTETERALQKMTSCDAVDALAAKENFPSSGSIGFQRLSDLPPAIAQAVQGLPDNKISSRISVNDADVFIMVCGRKDPNGLPSRDDVSLQLEREKLERLADRRLRDLRRQALIDIRL